MKLEDTIGLMCSDDFKDRMKAEYIQLRLRLRGAAKYWDAIEKATPEGQHMAAQINGMMNYRIALERRMEDIGINVDAISRVLWEE